MTLKELHKLIVDRIIDKYDLDLPYTDYFSFNLGYDKVMISFLQFSHHYISCAVESGQYQKHLLIKLNSKYKDFNHFIRHGEIANEDEMIFKLMSNFQTNTSYPLDDYLLVIDRVLNFIGA